MEYKSNRAHFAIGNGITFHPRPGGGGQFSTNDPKQQEYIEGLPCFKSGIITRITASTVKDNGFLNRVVKALWSK